MASKASAKAAPKSAAVEKRELSANNYIALVAVATIVVLLICGFIGRMLLTNSINNTKLILKKTQASGDLDTKLNTISPLVDNYKGLGDKKTLIMHSLPTTADFPALVSTIQTMSSSAGTRLRSIDPTVAGAQAAPVAPAQAGKTQEYQFSVDISGGYPQVVQFFRNIEKSARPMHVVSASMSGDNSQVEAIVTISTYFQDKADISDKMEELK